MKCFLRMLAILVLIIACAAPVTAEDWREHGSDHFIIFYTGDKDFAKDVARNAESYYKKIAVGL
ncbi:MAG: hypothetical protein V3S04_00115, partial [Candidatus Omnitrophota bacterium]